MTTSTRRTFQGGEVVAESVQLSQSAKAAALSAQTQRLESTTARQRQDNTAAQNQAIYRGGGLYSSLGADGGSRPRGNITSGGVPVGGVVPANGGLVGGMPAPFGGDAAALKLIEERVSDVAFERGPQIGTNRPTPNLLDASAGAADTAPRYPQDRYFQTSTRQTWQWVDGGAGEGYWDVAAESDLLPIGIEAPAVQFYPGITNGAIRYRVEGATVANRLPDDTAGTAGAATVFVAGVAATFGSTILQPTGRLSVSVTAAGTGLMIVTVELRQI